MNVLSIDLIVKLYFTSISYSKFPTDSLEQKLTVSEVYLIKM